MRAQESLMLMNSRVGRGDISPPPPQTGRADFPHPAFLKSLAWGIHSFACCLALQPVCISERSVSFRSRVKPNRHASPLRQTRLQLRPLAPPALPGFLATRCLRAYCVLARKHQSTQHMGASDSLTSQIEVISSLDLLALTTRKGLPGSSPNLSVRAIPFHPGRSDGCICSLLHHR